MAQSWLSPLAPLAPVPNWPKCPLAEPSETGQRIVVDFLLVDGKVDEGDQPGASQPAVWRLETSGPAILTRQGGWSATALKPGDRVSVTINPMKEAGQRNARLNKVTLVDTGQELGATYLDLDLRRPQ